MQQGGFLSWARGGKDRRNPDRDPVAVVAFPSRVPGTQRIFQTPLPAPASRNHLWGFMGPALFPLRRVGGSKFNYFVGVFFLSFFLKSISVLNFALLFDSLSLLSNEVLEDEALLA